MSYPKVSTTGEHTGAAFGVPASPRFPQVEEAVLAHWKADDTFRASVENRSPGERGENEFVFYDGPPFANGLPHYGHLLTGYVKDVVPRYQTMRGRRVERRFGWDTHGLPAELEAMRLNGIKTTDEILELGIEKFNEACRDSVMKYTGEWRDYVTRQARWVDFENDYRTMNPDYMESVIWAFKSLFDKGYVYEGFRVLPYCWNDETPLSNHELRMDDEVYQNRQDPAVTVGYLLSDAGTDPVLDGAHVLVWTTTPWTLPSNLAVMVGSDIDYVVVEAPVPGAGTTARYLLAEARLATYARELADADGEFAVLGRYKGADLVGRTYEPPFSYYAGHENAFRVVAADDAVTTTDGTGVVHTAGAFGEVDKEVTDREGIEAVMPVSKSGRFTVPVADYEDVQVFDANALIIEHLRNATRGEGSTGSVTPGTVLLRRETYDHSYPHCWRCREPLIYKGVESWFVEVTAFKDRMVELNRDITWVPDHVKNGQFGKWLENARDWSITRNRFWGSPVPVWKSDDPAHPRLDVYGSFAEMERDFGDLPRDREGNPDLHRPFVDELTRPNPDDPTGRSTMRRVEDVLDVWFDSGSMSYAQVHYPFENAEWFAGTDAQDAHFPADFIVEYIGQTRGWFYTLHVLATAIFDRPAFSSCVSHGIVLGNDGQKMSKSLRNYPDVTEVFDRDGADAMRWFLMASPILRGSNLVVTEEGIREGVRQVLIPLWNSWSFFALYANAMDGGAGYEAQWSTASTDPLDRYLLAKLRVLVSTVTTQLDAYDVPGACESVRQFVDVLTNWYIRRSRERFWDTGSGDASVAHAAFDTLYTALEVVTRVSAPLLPLVTEEIWRGLTGGRSVHLEDWPDATLLPDDDDLVAAMDQVRSVCSTGSSLRKAEKLRVRLPLTELTVVTPDPAGLEPFAGIIADELNVKAVRVLDVADAQGSDFGISRRLVVNARVAGPRLGRDVQVAIKGSKSGDWSVADDGTVTSGGLALVEGEYTLDTVVDAGEAGSRATAMMPGGGFVVLDTDVSPELELEGAARDLVRAVQQARRDAGLDVSDRISLEVAGAEFVYRAVLNHRDLVTGEVLAEHLSVGPDLDALEAGGDGVTEAVVGERYPVRLRVTRR
ncbi:isoleucine--tRNA ligase [Oryzobacter terrae]|uniref:isoleucine--tRNA ligase n=1 Tax=Oryzobacter terrae TaxID=1620385 RepID=UPI0036729669